MPTLHQNIRGALQQRALLTSGFPTFDAANSTTNRVAVEGVGFRQPAPAVGEKYARMTLIPSSARPYDVGGGERRHIGIFQVSLFWSVVGDPGTGPIEALADAVRAMFATPLTLRLNGESIKIEYAERAGTPADNGWLNCPVTVGWHCFSRN